MNHLEMTAISLQNLSNGLPPFVHPIYKNLKNDRIECIGSGFILEVYGGRFFVTAAHVFDHRTDENPLFYFTDKENIQNIDGAFEVSQSKTVRRDDDKIDIAVVALPGGRLADGQMKAATIDISQIDGNNSFASECKYVVSGFPLTKNKLDYKSNLVSSREFAWLGAQAPIEAYEKVGVKASNNILLSFSQRGTFRHDGETGFAFPNPQGMSGSPVWRLEGERNAQGYWEAKKSSLAGVLIEHKKAVNAMLATNIYYALAMAYKLSKI